MYNLAIRINMPVGGEWIKLLVMHHIKSHTCSLNKEQYNLYMMLQERFLVITILLGSKLDVFKKS